jgi:hypothetical protein
MGFGFFQTSFIDCQILRKDGNLNSKNSSNTVYDATFEGGIF